MNYSIQTNQNSKKSGQPLVGISMLGAGSNSGVFYWNDHIPAHLKTKHELLLQYRQPKPDAQVRGVKRHIFEQKGV